MNWETFKEKKNDLLAVALMAFSFMGAYGFFTGNVKSMQWYLFYYGRFFLMLLFTLYACYIHVDKNNRLAADWMKKEFIRPEIIILLYSILIWLIQQPSMPYITRGISDTMFMIGAYIAGISIAKVLGTNVFRYGLIASFITVGISAVLGLINLKSRFFSSFFSGQNQYIELSETLFVIGLYIICIIFSDKKISSKKSKGTIILAIICFLIGGKRIGIAGLILTVIFGVIVGRLSEKRKLQMMNITGWVIIVVVFVYVYFSVTGTLSELLKKYGINMMGRNILYNYFRQFCEFKVSFFGNGVGFVGRKFTYTTSKELYNMAVTKALHNDFMKNYIELGFIGFFAWVWYWIKHIPNYLAKKIGTQDAFVCFTLFIYSFITYATDNTAGYFNYQLHLAALITAVSSGYLKLEDIEKNDNDKSEIHMERISIIMSTYKEPVTWVKKAVESILCQTYREKEFIIIVDDPTNEDVVRYLKEIEQKNKFVSLIINDTNIGLVRSLNKGIEKSTGKYIARMDADDISLPERLSEELLFLKRNNLDIVGSAYEIINDNEILETRRNPSNNMVCRKILRYKNCTVHPTWLVKREVYDQLNGYRMIDACEDYDFLIRAVLSDYKIGNTDKVLFQYRNNPNSISHTKSLKQEATMNLIASYYRKKLIVSEKDYKDYLKSNKFHSDMDELERKWSEVDKVNSKVNFVVKIIRMIYTFISSKCYRKEKIRNQIVKFLFLMDKFIN